MIEVIVIGIVVFGVLLLFILFVCIWVVDVELKFKKYCFKDVGLVDLFNYVVMVDDGVIVGKNGLFIVFWFYKGDDNVSSIDE